jgi:hypothetical protein
MKRTLGLSLVLMLGAGSASAQIDCSGGCTTIKYGLGHPDDLDFRKHPTNVLAYGASDFSGSYFFIRSNPANTGSLECGLEREYTPVRGQVILKEQDGCVISSQGPTCTAGTNVGATCHLPLGSTSADNTTECGAGGTCTLAGAGCPVEIPLTNNLTPFADRSEISAPIFSNLPNGLFDLLSSGAFALSGSSSSDPEDDCLPRNIRTVPSQGQRYRLPASRGGDGVKTFIRWNESNVSGLYRLGDDGIVCCNSTSTICDLAGGFLKYPILNRVTCGSTTGTPPMVPFVQTPDWIFDGEAGTHFHTDPEFVVPGQQVGVCRVNRNRSCTSLPQPSNLGIDCAATFPDVDPVTPGNQPDSCDFREPGIRSSRPPVLPNDYPNTVACGNSMYVLKGTPRRYCHINERYIEDGDPGPDCGVVNFGARTLADFDPNCDGVPDLADKCPLVNEFDHFADADSDCAISAAACRGDECECGDQTLNGIVDVSDLVAINAAIFGSQATQQICDTNLDDRCNVSDIVGANAEIFVKGSSICSHVTTVLCGNGFLNGSEECDDGGRCQGGTNDQALCVTTNAAGCPGGLCQRVSGDGCSAICRCEPGSALPGCP